MPPPLTDMRKLAEAVGKFAFQMGCRCAARFGNCPLNGPQEFEDHGRIRRHAVPLVSMGRFCVASGCCSMHEERQLSMAAGSAASPQNTKESDPPSPHEPPFPPRRPARSSAGKASMGASRRPASEVSDSLLRHKAGAGHPNSGVDAPQYLDLLPRVLVDEEAAVCLQQRSLVMLLLVAIASRLRPQADIAPRAAGQVGKLWSSRSSGVASFEIVSIQGCLLSPYG